MGLTGDGPDLVLEAGDLVLDRTLQTAVLASLFADGEASSEHTLPAGDGDRRGWWPDSLDGRRWGSHLWLAARGKLTTETLELVRESAEACCAWMIADGIADTVRAVVVRLGLDRLGLTLEIGRGSAERWSDLWAATRASTFSTPAADVRLVPLP